MSKKPDSLVNLEEAEVIAGTGFMNLAGGIRNPGVVFSNSKFVVLAQGHKTLDFFNVFKGVGDQVDWKGIPYLFFLDKDLEKLKFSEVVVDSRLNSGLSDIEDLRLFFYKDAYYCNHAYFSLRKKPLSLIKKIYHLMIGLGLPLNELRIVRNLRKKKSGTFYFCRQVISKLDLGSAKLNFYSFPSLDFEQRLFEKNWVYFSHNEKLHIIYSFSPFRLLMSATDELHSFKTVHHVEMPSMFEESLGGFSGYISLSTNPIEYDEKSYLLFIHKYKIVSGNRVYYHWAVLLDKETLLPSFISSIPVLVGGSARGLLSGVVFLTAALKVGDVIFLFSGEGNTEVTVVELSKAQLDGCLEAIII